MFVYPPDSSIEFTKGEFSEFQEYKFGKKPKVAHYFCGTCGSSCMGRSIGTFKSPLRCTTLFEWDNIANVVNVFQIRISSRA
jgi:hypothetical protein